MTTCCCGLQHLFTLILYIDDDTYNVMYLAVNIPYIRTNHCVPSITRSSCVEQIKSYAIQFNIV